MKNLPPEPRWKVTRIEGPPEYFTKNDLAEIHERLDQAQRGLRKAYIGICIMLTGTVLQLLAYILK